MASKPILRLERVASIGAVRLMGRHWMRGQETPNADTIMLDGVRILAGSGDPAADVEAALGTLDKPPRKDACLAVELLMGASEEQFRPEGGAPYSRDPARVEEWATTAMAHARKEFGDRLVSAVLHLDEQTPHIQAVLVPIDEKLRAPAGRSKDRTPRLTRALNADGMMGNRDTLSGYQQRYEDSMQPIGVGSRTHKTERTPTRTTVREWYGRQETAVRSIEHDAQLATEARRGAQVDRTDASADRTTAAVDRAVAAVALADAAAARQNAMEAHRLAQETVQRRKDEEGKAANARVEAEKAATRSEALTTLIEATMDGRITAASDDPQRGRRLLFGGVSDPQQRAALAEEVRPAGSKGWTWAARYFRMKEADKQQVRETIRTQTLTALERPRKAIADLTRRFRKVGRHLDTAEQMEAARVISEVQQVVPRMAGTVRQQDLVR